MVGLLFLLSGRGKLFVRERREQMRQTLIEAHVPFPELNTVVVSAVEFVCGLLLVIGALTLKGRGGRIPVGPDRRASADPEL